MKCKIVVDVQHPSTFLSEEVEWFDFIWCKVHNVVDVKGSMQSEFYVKGFAVVNGL